MAPTCVSFTPFAPVLWLRRKMPLAGTTISPFRRRHKFSHRTRRGEEGEGQIGGKPWLENGGEHFLPCSPFSVAAAIAPGQSSEQVFFRN